MSKRMQHAPGTVVLALVAGFAVGTAAHEQAPVASEGGETPVAAEDVQAVVDGTCRRCHNDRMRTGNLSLADFEVGRAVEQAAVAERMVRKLAGRLDAPGRRPAPGRIGPDGAGGRSWRRGSTPLPRRIRIPAAGAFSA